MQQPLITLLSDFGLHDEYVGVMKGAIAQINSNLRVIDITHQIPPQNIAAGRFCLMNAYRYFPMGTIHVAVVDPGVGGKRRAIAVEIAEGFFIAPDNGLLSGVLSQSKIQKAVELTNPRYWYTPQISNTFHGRDVFAPVGAHLASGVPLKQLGKEIDPTSLICLELPKCSNTKTGFLGCIQYIDYFGNLVTNIPGSYVRAKNWSIRGAGKVIKGYETYTDVGVGEEISLVGSHGWVEIAVNSGNAQLQLQMQLGNSVEIFIVSD